MKLHHNNEGSDDGPRWLVGVAAALVIGWLALQLHAFQTEQATLIRLVLTVLMGGLILGRPKRQPTTSAPPATAWLLTLLALGGVGLSLTGLIIDITQLEWLGVLSIAMAAALRGTPSHCHRDIWLGAVMIYWAVPLPHQLFSVLQATMQQGSVAGTEGLLQVLNVRIWAHDLTLYTETHSLAVPGFCSGMRTATTVFLLSLGIGILRRLRWRQTALLIVVSLLNALLLNILRIASMVIAVPSLQDRSYVDFLHDTTGFLLIGAVLMVVVEVALFTRWNHRHSHYADELNEHRMRRVTEHPPFWRRLARHRWRLVMLLLVCAGIGFVATKSRQYHRSQMIRDVANGLRERGLMELAETAAEEALALTPDDTEWHFSLVRILLLRGRYDRVLSELDKLEAIPQRAVALQDRILRAYALMSLGRIEEAEAIVVGLPEDVKQSDPRVAMILAEMALRGNDPRAVAVHVVTAAGWVPNAGRIRHLYPYLRLHRKWEAMRGTDLRVPYHDPAQAFSLMEAYMQLDNVPRVAALTLEVMEHWPDDVRLLEPLYFLVLRRHAKSWEDRFAAQLHRTLGSMQAPDPLYELLYKCFDLARPDLGWAVYRRIEQIDPEHPALPMAVAIYGHRWYRVRKRRMGMPSASPTDLVSLKPYLLLTREMPAWRGLLDWVPAGRDLLAPDVTDTRKAYLQRALTQFASRKRAHPLSLDMHYLYVRALEMDGQINQAKRELSTIVAAHATEAESARIVLSRLYERKGDWINVYETLYDYLTPAAEESDTPQWHLLPLLRFCRAQLELKLGLGALETARRAVEIFPYAPQAAGMLARAQALYSSSEEALATLGQPRVRPLEELELLEVRALRETQRYSELDQFSRKAQLPPPRTPTSAPQEMMLPPAELALHWVRIALPTEPEFAIIAATITGNIAGTDSPYLRGMMQLWKQAYTTGCHGALARPATWEATGRTPVEQATALNQLSLLLCREERYPEARLAAQRAVERLPSVPLLHRILIGLQPSPGERLTTITSARAACPDDSSLWLAELAARGQSLPDAATPTAEVAALRTWVEQELARGCLQQLSPADQTRAGEFLFRKGLRQAATQLIRPAVAQARGLLPTYVMGMKCALHQQDRRWAEECTSQAIAASLRPMPALFEQLVRLKASHGQLDTDPEMINALRHLRESDPDNVTWAQMLGYIRFQRGGWEIIDALSEMSVAVHAGVSNPVPYLVAAEVSRLMRNYDRAADYLQRGMRQYPDDLRMLNNLAYVLAHDPARRQEALALVPRLETYSRDNLSVLDTLGTVYLKAGHSTEAEKMIAMSESLAAPGSGHWFRARMHRAELLWQREQREDAIAILRRLLTGARGISDEDVLAANALLAGMEAGDLENLNATMIRGHLEAPKSP